MCIIYDDLHAEVLSGEFDTFDAALMELRKIAKIPFGDEPNNPPCANWAHCAREYYVHQYDNSLTPLKLMSQTFVLKISATETVWLFKGK
ncbi:MAG: hypothetical protein ACOYZ6_17685 [Chloroflexota bacterium]